ncbi:uncharacterized protein UTRI_01256_B [Ustilago trichophora]|uniref:Uncharacterized protein n=1 Tax=Ustilago trichophora TaxID=86804 RepID=A0A5C3DU71_9BASI|nr:uncharacterized protein UTRI_01256_B [Ustilago trichophora]
MQSHAYHGSQAGGSSYPSYPPVAPSSPYYQQQHNQRRYSVESNRPPSQAGSSRSPYGQPPRSPLHSLQQHPRDESEDYEERDLGEIAAANQAAQEQRWGPHAALSEAPGRFELYQDQHYMDRHTSVPAMPSYEPAHYDGGFYMEPPGLYEPAPQYNVAPSLGAPSIASSHTLGGRSRQSLPVYASPLMHTSATSPASEPPNMFNVTAAHHLPGGRARAQDPFAGDLRAQPGARIGDPLPGFPNWSHTWYGGHLSADGHAYTMVPPGSGQSGWESETLSHGRHGPPGPGSPYGPFPYGRTSMNDYVKEERIRMLEKEFGPKVTRKGKGKAADDDDDDDEDTEPEQVPIGGVDEKGRLVLPRQKVRITTRCFQCIVSLAAAGLGIGGFIMIRPKDKAPPSGTMPSFVLYGVSAISTIVCLWLFAFKPCCKSGRDSSGAGPMAGGGAGNGMVIPIMTGGGAGAKGGPGMFGKKNKKAMMQQGTTVNLIVDPSLLGKRTADDSDSDTDDDETLPGEERRRKKRKGKKRQKLGMLGNMKLQARWRVARSSLKWDCAWDVVLCLLWGAAAVLTLGVGKKCPSGSAEGWCNLYNGAIACSIVATLLFMVAIYCDVVGLRASKSPPKARI